MYPHSPPSHRPTNYYWILVLCVVAMLLVLFVALRTVAGRFTSAAAQTTLAAPAASAAKPQVSAAAEATPAVSAEGVAAVAPAATPGGVVEVDPKALTESPGTYRSRAIKVRGTVFYSGKLEGGKTWIQIVDKNNVYVDGQMADSLPASIAKGMEVELTGIAAGLTSVTASNGKDYDQAYIDPIQKIEPIK